MRGFVFPLVLGFAALGLVGLTPADAQARGRHRCYSDYTVSSPAYFPVYGGYYTGGVGGYCYPTYSTGYYGGAYGPYYGGFYGRHHGRRAVRTYPRPTPYLW